MLVLSRKIGESVVVSADQCNVWIKVVRISGGRVKIAFDAPGDIAIQRSELCPGDGEHSFGTGDKMSQIKRSIR
jgi:carbon storage regulator CsrA